MKNLLTEYATDFLNLLFPQTCTACGEKLTKQENPLICLLCEYNLPETQFETDPTQNEMAKHFWGRAPIQYAAAYLYFVKHGRTQNLLHALKYDSNKNIGEWLGKKFGEKLIQTPEFKQITALVPVPLHTQKQQQRGYNQAEIIAQGMAQSMQIPCCNWLQRSTYTETQTKKSRSERVQNVESVFTIINPKEIENQHILLIDDVVTTGATLESAANLLLKNHPSCKVSVAAIAYAHHL